MRPLLVRDLSPSSPCVGTEIARWDTGSSLLRAVDCALVGGDQDRAWHVNDLCLTPGSFPCFHVSSLQRPHQARIASLGMIHCPWSPTSPQRTKYLKVLVRRCGMTLSNFESSYASGLNGLSSFPWHVSPIQYPIAVVFCSESRLAWIIDVSPSSNGARDVKITSCSSIRRL